MISSHTLANLSRREADLLIREQVPELGGIVARKLGRVAFAIYAARTLAVKKSTLAALVDLPWVGFDDDHIRMTGQSWLLEHRGGRRPEVRGNNWLVLHEATRTGAGLAVLPCHLADPDPMLQPDRRHPARGLCRSVAAGPSRPARAAAGARRDGRGHRALPARAALLEGRSVEAGNVSAGRGVCRR